MNKEELLERLDKVEIKEESIENAFWSLEKIADEVGAYEVLENFINSKQLEKIALKLIKEYGIYDVKNFLDGIGDMKRDIYYITRHGKDKVRNVTVEDLKQLKADLEYEIDYRVDDWF